MRVRSDHDVTRFAQAIMLQLTTAIGAMLGTVAGLMSGELGGVGFSVLERVVTHLNVF